MPPTTVYEYLRGKSELGSDRASIILRALGLQITSKPKKGKRPRKEV